jgi:plastocyanin
MRTCGRIAPAIAVLALTLLPAPAPAATTFDVAVSSNLFNPSMLTIQVGDSVRWTNSSGFHDVSSDAPGQFRSGDPALAPWTFTHTFTQAGTFPYHCELHGAAGGVGMSGTIVVQGGGGNPGSLQLSAATYSVGEGAGHVTITATRVGGDNGAVSVGYATSNGTATAGSDYTAANGTLSWAANDDNPKTFNVTILNDAADEPNETFTATLSGPGGGASLGSPATAVVTIVDDDNPPAQAGSLQFSAATYEAGESDGTATVTVTRAGGSDGVVTVGFATSDGTATAGADYTATSGTLSWGNHDAAAKSFDVSVLDDTAVEDNETVNLALSGPTGGASLGTPQTATLTLLDDDAQPFVCVEDANTLCLNGGRFQIKVDWQTPSRPLGPAHAIDLTSDSGLFYFLDPTNVEFLVKVLNGCGFQNPHYWVFFAATTTVEFTVTVTDSDFGFQRHYHNDFGHPANAITDTRAFATCP